MRDSPSAATSALISQALTLARTLAVSAGALVREMRGNNSFEVSLKRPRDLLTTADLAADKLISEGILAQFPDHSILSEESSPHYPPERMAKGPLWVIDPIDGTVNYAAGQLQVGVSIAFLLNGVAEAAAVYAPFYDELFSARRGGGAFLGDVGIRPKQSSDLKRALIATGFPYDRSERTQMMKRVEKVLAHSQDLRRLGAASLDTCWVACGRMDAYYEDVAPWDIAAGSLIAREAGARVGQLGPSEKNDKLPLDLRSDQFLVATREIYDQVFELLKD